MEGFGLNTAKSFLGKNVNLHLKDGSVIVNVQMAEIKIDEFKRKALVTCIPFGNRKRFTVLLKNIAWAEMLNSNFFLMSG